MKRKSEIQRFLRNKVVYFLGITIGVSSTLFLTYNYYKNFDKTLGYYFSKEIDVHINTPEIENKINYYINDAANYQIIKHKKFFYNSIRSSLDSITDDYIKNIKPEIKEYINESIENNAERWLFEKLK